MLENDKRASFLCPKSDNFAYLHTPQDQNEIRLIRCFFPKSASPLCRSVAIFSSVQAYTQPYSLGGRIAKNELSVTIHEISTS